MITVGFNVVLVLAIAGLHLTNWEAAGPATWNTTRTQANFTAVGNGTLWETVETPEPNIWLWVINLRCVERTKGREGKEGKEEK